MKKSILTKGLFFLLLLIGFFSFIRCENDYIETTHKSLNDNKIIVKHYKLSELKNQPNVYNKINNLTSNNNYASKIINFGQYGFSIETEDIVYIEDNGNYSYTFKINRDTITNLLENLVLKPKDNGSFETYLFQYNFDEQDKQSYLNGTPIENKEQKTNILLLDDIDSNIFYKSGSQNQTEGVPGPLPSGWCWEMIDYEVNIDYDAGTWEVIEYYQIVKCGGGGSSSGNGDGNNDGGWSGNGNTDGGNQPGDGNTNGTSGSTSGNNDSETSPIITTPVGLDGAPVFEQNPCKQLKALKKPDQENIKPIIDSLKTLVNEPVEYSTNFKKYINEGFPTEYFNETNIGYDKSRSRLFLAQSWYGQIHTHPAGTFPMFSWLDLKAINDLYVDAKGTHKPDVFLMIVCPNDKVYCLKIDSQIQLDGNLNADWNNPEYNGMSNEEKNEQLALMMEEVFNSDSDIEKAFITRFKNYGISLYRANADITQWTKIELENPLASVPVKKETPC